MDLREQLAARDLTHLLPDEPQPASSGSWAYQKTLEVAGVRVLGYKDFGSYQGQWIAEVEFPDGTRRYVSGYYGSCSVCDAFEGEFGYDDEDASPERLQDFGRRYLTNCMTWEEMMEDASQNADWDMDAGLMVSWLEERKV